MAESQANSALMKFPHAIIGTLHQGLSDEQLKTTAVKGIKSKKFVINLKNRHERGDQIELRKQQSS